jgi:hypothetical protein
LIRSHRLSRDADEPTRDAEYEQTRNGHATHENERSMPKTNKHETGTQMRAISNDSRIGVVLENVETNCNWRTGDWDKAVIQQLAT